MQSSFLDLMLCPACVRLRYCATGGSPLRATECARNSQSQTVQCPEAANTACCPCMPCMKFCRKRCKPCCPSMQSLHTVRVCHGHYAVGQALASMTMQRGSVQSRMATGLHIIYGCVVIQLVCAKLCEIRCDDAPAPAQQLCHKSHVNVSNQTAEEATVMSRQQGFEQL